MNLMQKWSPTWRGSPFQPGHLYLTLVAVPSLPLDESLISDEILIYEQSGYSRYDNCSVYAFVTNDGQRRTWWLNDETPLKSWRGVFAVFDSR